MKTFTQRGVVLLAFLLLSGIAVGQPRFFDSLDVNAGLSVTDGINIGTRYRFGQNNIGINVSGSLPFVNKDFNMVIVSASWYRHLWGKSRFTHQRPWYVKPGIHHLYTISQLTRTSRESASETVARLYLGRDFNLSDRLGISFAIGPTLTLYDRFYGYEGKYYPLYVGGGFDFLIFYRLRGKSDDIP